MIWFTTLLMLQTFAVDDWERPQLDLFNSISSQRAVVLPDGGLMLLETSPAQLLHISNKGKLIRRIGREGNGPADFQLPLALYAVGERLYVQNQDFAGVYTPNGDFLERVKGLHYGDTLRKVINGWVIFRTQASLPTGECTYTLLHLDDNLENARVLHQQLTRLEMTKQGDGTIISRINPAPEKNLLAFSPSGNALAFRAPDAREIMLIRFDGDAPTLKIPIPFKRVPFSEEYGEKFWKSMSSTPPSPSIRRVKDFPDYFPVIDDLHWTPENHLFLRQRGLKGVKKLQVLYLSAEGAPVKPQYPSTSENVVLGFHHDFVYTCTYDEQADEYTIQRIRKEHF